MSDEYLVSILEAIRAVQHELYIANLEQDREQIVNCSDRLYTLQRCLPIDDIIQRLK